MNNSLIDWLNVSDRMTEQVTDRPTWRFDVRFTERLTDRLTERLIHRSTDWTTNRSTDWTSRRSTNLTICRSIHWMTNRSPDWTTCRMTEASANDWATLNDLSRLTNSPTNWQIACVTERLPTSHITAENALVVTAWRDLNWFSTVALQTWTVQIYRFVLCEMMSMFLRFKLLLLRFRWLWSLCVHWVRGMAVPSALDVWATVTAEHVILIKESSSHRYSTGCGVHKY
jgi:hypothetical protein